MSDALDPGRALYPFLFETAGNGGSTKEAVLAEVRASTLQKARDVIALRARLLAEYADMLVEAGSMMAVAFAAGHKLLAFGNGGSATDAQDAAADCLDPPCAGWHPLPALALANDSAVVTAIANDVGVENVFSRQIIALGQPGDIALGITTSGGSANVLSALAAARALGMHTIALTGYDGGAIVRERSADYCFVARLEYVPRIQEGHATLWHALLSIVQARLVTPADDADAPEDRTEVSRQGGETGRD